MTRPKSAENLPQEELARTVSLLQATLDSTADGILVVDPQGRIVNFNHTFVNMWRIPESILKSRDDARALAFVLDQLSAPEAFLSKIKTLYAQPDAESFDVLEFKDGRVFERYSRPHRMDGRSVGRVWSFRDVTQSRRAETRRKESVSRALRFHAVLLELAKMDHTDLPLAITRITEADARAINVERVSIWQFTPDRTELNCEDLYRLSQDLHATGLRLQARHYPRYFQALEESRTVAADDALRDPRTDEFAEGYLKTFGISSMLDVPIRVRGKVVGVLCHEHVGDRREWNLEEQEFTASLADLIAQVLEASERRRAEEAIRTLNAELERRVADRTFELEKSKEAFQQQSSLLHLLLQSLSDGVALADETGRVLLHNSAAERISGMNPSNTRGSDWRKRAGIFLADGVTPCPPHQLPLARALNGEDVQEAELFLRPPGRPKGVWISCNARLLPQEPGSLKRAVTIFHDITERKRAELALRESESRFRQLAENIKGVFWIVEPRAARALYLSPAFEEIWGRPRESVYRSTRAWIRAIHPEDRKRVVEMERNARSAYEREYRIVRPDGSIRWIHDRAFPLRNEKGKVYRIVGIGEDITERKRSEGRLAAQHAVTLALADSDSLEEAAPKVLQAVCAHLGWQVGGLWRVDADAEALRCVEMWHAPGIRVGAFEKISRQTAFPKGRGLPGRVWAVRKPAWIDDVTRDRNFPRAPIAARVGLHGAFGLPLRLGKKVLGVIEFFSREIRKPDQELLRILDSAGSQIGQFIERKRAELGLRESEQRFRATFEQAAVGASHTSREGHWLRVNRKFCDMLGYTLPELLRLRFQDITHPDDVDRDVRHMRKMLQGRIANYTADKRYIRKDGSILWANLTVTPVRDESGQTLYFLAIVKDITDLKKAEAALRSREEYFRSLIENASDLIATVTPDSRALYVSPSVKRVLGYAPSDLIGRSALELVHPEDAPAVRSILARTLKQPGQPHSAEFRFLNRQGTWTYLETIGTYVPDSPAGSVVIVNARNITDRKHAEEVLARQARELARSNADLEQFAYVASHDLQEPLRSIAGYSQLLARRYKGRLDADADQFIAYAVDGATRLQDLISDLLTYSRVGRASEKFTRVSCEAALKRSLYNLNLSLREHRATVTHDPLPSVRANGPQLELLLQNLIANAVKFHGRRPPRVHVSARRKGDEWIFSVRDNGIGIDRQYFKRLFVIFQRLHSQEKYPGTGIGLALCKKIVQAHGGRIGVESRVRRGSTFWFSLPSTSS